MFNINFFKEISHTFPTKQYVNGCLQLTFFNFQKLHKIPKIRLVKGFAGLSILNNFLISITLTPSFKVRILIPLPLPRNIRVPRLFYARILLFTAVFGHFFFASKFLRELLRDSKRQQISKFQSHFSAI